LTNLEKITPEQPLFVQKALPKGQGRLNGLQPVGVIDIGSNSVRLVVYEGLVRSPTVLFNEKIMCGLGQGLSKTGLLNEAAVEMTLRTLGRFSALCRQLQVVQLHALATAAAREAKNGADFIAQAEAILGQKIQLLSGVEEAAYSAYGVLSSFYCPHGLVGDFGGGSLELISIKYPEIDKGISLPLGGLRLCDMAQGSVEQASKIVRQHLCQADLVGMLKPQNFYAVGGTWRNLAKLHMAQIKYPLPVMHHYQPDMVKLQKFLRRIIKGNLEDLRNIEMISKNRRQLLPYGAVVLSEIIHLLRPDNIVFSGSGVREGYLYASLPALIRSQDPLLAACDYMAILRARSADYAHELIEWSDRAFKVLGLKENEEERRLREATCYLSDIAWRINPDYRGQDAADQVAFGDYNGLDHQGRCFAALALFFRNQGLVDDAHAPSIIKLIDKQTRYRARVLAAVMRLSNLFCASSPGILPQLKWQQNNQEIILEIPDAYRALIAERLLGRLQNLAKLTGKTMRFAVIEHTKPDESVSRKIEHDF